MIRKKKTVSINPNISVIININIPVKRLRFFFLFTRKFNKRSAHLPLYLTALLRLFCQFPFLCLPLACAHRSLSLAFFSSCPSCFPRLTSFTHMASCTTGLPVNSKSGLAIPASLSHNFTSFSPPDTFTWICSRCQLV